jgi:hypothetical protein
LEANPLANFVFPCSKGRFVEKYSLLTGSDNIVVVLLLSSGLQVDATLAGYTNLATLLAATSDEATFTNYARIVLASGNITITTTTTVTVALTGNLVWNSAGGALTNTLGALLTCYRPTSGSADSAIIPLTKHDFSTTTQGGNLTGTVTTVATAS